MLERRGMEDEPWGVRGESFIEERAIVDGA